MNPYVVYQDDDVLVVFKPKGLPTAPLKSVRGDTLLDWAMERYPRIRQVEGRSLWEPGLLHRLDTPTSGLVVMALNQLSFDTLVQAQKDGLVIKTYRAGIESLPADSTWPPLPPELHRALENSFPERGFALESHFRPFGVGRKSVRPCDSEARNASRRTYRTVFRKESADSVICTITEGFRHQIRSHLAWTGYPISGDDVYGRTQTFPEDADGTSPGLQLECIKVQMPGKCVGLPTE